jgi:hypothetical protein
MTHALDRATETGEPHNVHVLPSTKNVITTVYWTSKQTADYNDTTTTIDKYMRICETSGSHGGEYEDESPLGYSAV